MAVQIPYTLKLEHPVQFGEERVTEVVFERRMQAADLKGLPTQNLQFDHYFKILSRLTGRPPSFVEKIDGDDFITLMEVINSFLTRSPMTGSAE